MGTIVPSRKVERTQYSNPYNFRLLQSAKIAPRMHQNAPFFHSEVKKFCGEVTQDISSKRLIKSRPSTIPRRSLVSILALLD